MCVASSSGVPRRQDGGRRHDIEPGAHHLQGRLVVLAVEGVHAVLQDHDEIIVMVRPARGGHAATVRLRPAEHQGQDAIVLQEGIEARAHKGVRPEFLYRQVAGLWSDGANDLVAPRAQQAEVDQLGDPARVLREETS